MSVAAVAIVNSLTPGAVVLQRPWHALWWCIKNGTIPRFILLIQAILSAFIFILQGGDMHSHVLLYIGNGTFAHTALGQSRLFNVSDLGPGYLETATILDPLFKWNNGATEAVKQTIGLHINYVGFFATPIFRFLGDHRPVPFSLEEPGKDVAKKLSKLPVSIHNCTEYVLQCLRIALGIDLAKEYKLAPHGIYPSDYLNMPKHFKQRGSNNNS